jgi:hypothetical protein
MDRNFQAIKIIAFDDKATYQSDPHSELRHVVLTLSAVVSEKWSKHFNACWTSHLYMKKRKASASGNRLTIYCVPDELQKFHIPELNKVIVETNQAYEQYLIDAKRAADAQAQRDAAEKANLAALKSSLKFD